MIAEASTDIQPVPVADARMAAAARATRRRWAVIALVHAAVVLLWEVLVRAAQVPAFILPAPSDVLATLAVPTHAWVSNTLVTAAEIIGGYMLALGLGVALALVFTWSRLLTLLVFPLLVTLNMIPKVALGPIVIVWLSYGIFTNVLITFSLCFFPILLTTARGLREVEPDLLDLVHSLKGSRWQVFRYIQLPGSLPYIFSGMKVAAILAVAGAVVGEFVASERGLAYLMIQVQSSLDTAAMFMAVVLLSLLGITLYLIVLGLEHRFVPRDARKG
ncbi:ABC transporter permease [Roseomonas xinghualingensis]|uniref:ABC transporter permease n=1 Tax=Roseomonas xinghualingensis TaxID=2986475 RepID=UPI0021F219DD|nr:ABC transporter permease [Roseomonas sp. SXEYE001]MCV4208536.1 ABC transporter permease [Roseomonas sp. SXEYE001]